MAIMMWMSCTSACVCGCLRVLCAVWHCDCVNRHRRVLPWDVRICEACDAAMGMVVKEYEQECVIVRKRGWEYERERERKMYNTSLPSHERKKHLSVGLSERWFIVNKLFRSQNAEFLIYELNCIRSRLVFKASNLFLFSFHRKQWLSFARKEKL